MLLYSSFSMIWVKNPVYIICFFIFIIVQMVMVMVSVYGMSFFIFVLLLVYIGAIAVLFLFMVMLLNVKIYEINYLQWFMWWGFVWCLCVFLIFWWFVEVDNMGTEFFDVDFINLYFYDSIKVVGIYIYLYCGLVFLILSLFFIIAIIGSVYLVLNVAFLVKRQEVWEQIERSFIMNLKFKR